MTERTETVFARSERGKDDEVEVLEAKLNWIEKGGPWSLLSPYQRMRKYPLEVPPVCSYWIVLLFQYSIERTCCCSNKSIRGWIQWSFN